MVKGRGKTKVIKYRPSKGKGTITHVKGRTTEIIKPSPKKKSQQAKNYKNK